MVGSINASIDIGERVEAPLYAIASISLYINGVMNCHMWSYFNNPFTVFIN